jgi:hypothetical protein
MHDVIAAFVGSTFSYIAAFAYIVAVRRVGYKVFGFWLIFLWFPVLVSSP